MIWDRRPFEVLKKESLLINEDNKLLLISQIYVNKNTNLYIAPSYY